jgi:energy-converting hydrogenase Eha subunit A
MNVSMNSSASPAKLLALAVSEWLLVLPASVLVLAALLRLVQPREHEPARASWVIFAWARTHISQSGAGLVFIGLPGVAALILAAVLAHLIAD